MYSVDKIRSLLLGNGYSAKLSKILLREVRHATTKANRGKRTVGDDGYLALPTTH